jgi:hypothetical protein
MVALKVILSIVLFVFALIPLVFKNYAGYQNKIIIIIITVILILNIVIDIQQENENKKNKEDNKRLNRESRDLILLNSQLDNFIDIININLKLNKTYKFSELNPIYFGYEFMVYNKNIDVKEVLITNDNFKRGEEIHVSYQIYDAKIGGSEIRGGINAKMGTSDIDNLHTEISFPPNTYTLRDLDKGTLMIYLKENLLDKVENIMLNINSWILIDAKIGKDDWEKIDDISMVGGWSNYGLEMKKYYRINSTYSQSFKEYPWQIDMFNRKIRRDLE